MKATDKFCAFWTKDFDSPIFGFYSHFLDTSPAVLSRCSSNRWLSMKWVWGFCLFIHERKTG